MITLLVMVWLVYLLVNPHNEVLGSSLGILPGLDSNLILNGNPTTITLRKNSHFLVFTYKLSSLRKLNNNISFSIRANPVDYSLPTAVRCDNKTLGKEVVVFYHGNKTSESTKLVINDLLLRSLKVLDEKGATLDCITLQPTTKLDLEGQIQFKKGIVGELYVVHVEGGTYVIGRQFDVSLSLFGYKYQTINLSLYLHASQAPITDPLTSSIYNCCNITGSELHLLDVSVKATGTQYSFIERINATILEHFYGRLVSIRSNDKILAYGRFEPLQAVSAEFRGQKVMTQQLPFLLPVMLMEEMVILDRIGARGNESDCQNKANVYSSWPAYLRERVPLLIGPRTAMLHVVNDTECDTIKPHVESGVSHLVEAYAIIRGDQLEGQVLLKQIVYNKMWTLGPAILVANISRSKPIDLQWSVNIENGGSVYDPFNRRRKGGCSQTSHFHCPMGNLTGKHGALRVGKEMDIHSFYDENLQLSGLYSVIGRTLVIYSGSGQLLESAKIEPSIVAKETVEISFPGNYQSCNQESIQLNLRIKLAKLCDVPVGYIIISESQQVKNFLHVKLRFTGLNESNATANAVRIRDVIAMETLTVLKPQCGRTTRPMTTKSNIYFIVFGSVGPMLLICLLTLLFCICCILHYRRKSFQCGMYEVSNDYLSLRPMHGQAVQQSANGLDLPDERDIWELLPSDVTVDDKIGYGTFGQVAKGVLSVNVATKMARKHIRITRAEGKYPYTVAVKTLKGDASLKDRENFISEIDLLKTVSLEGHTHVVRMVGCVTMATPMMLVLEHITCGNLHEWLKAKNTKISPTQQPYPEVTGTYINSDISVAMPYTLPISSEETQMGTDNPAQRPSQTEDINTDEKPPTKWLTDDEIASFAYQIAHGMEYLCQLGIVHRDLACRNILVDSGNTLKISDFGLSRSCPVYVSDLRDRLPLRWMSPETVFEGLFTEKSDVWSYGVCLWEIGTLGELPYRDLSIQSLLVRIACGYRLDCPNHCSTSIYLIMLNCWEKDATKRPSFKELRIEFQTMVTRLDRSPGYIQINPSMMEFYFEN